jgi:hypothetical protein
VSAIAEIGSGAPARTVAGHLDRMRACLPFPVRARIAHSRIRPQVLSLARNHEIAVPRNAPTARTNP